MLGFAHTNSLFTKFDICSSIEIPSEIFDLKSPSVTNPIIASFESETNTKPPLFSSIFIKTCLIVEFSFIINLYMDKK